MQLAEWLHVSGVSYREFGALCGISKAYVGHLVCGRNRPSLDLLVKIIAVTEGSVGLYDWVEPDVDTSRPPF